MSEDEVPSGEKRAEESLAKLTKLFKRPETRVDAQRALSKLSAQGQIYAKHLVLSGPSSDALAAKESGLSVEQLRAAMTELEAALATLVNH